MKKPTFEKYTWFETFRFLHPTYTGWGFLVRVLIVLNFVGGLGAAILLLNERPTHSIAADECRYCSNLQKPLESQSRFVG
ncbi:hypothetical protein GUA87_07310 [Sneathiella sp. P13V-1]|uniref:hypothetical protein n=1 Tax=Sneathiella sp. P13V-1 TaxID=2697366 RepID=UPI00187B3896|nr:hypothetical protein [Sneathiella sp. P13V-1]MBE7636650.1 hypothetical protein [Sneathiella sp. P13V-1]